MPAGVQLHNDYSGFGSAEIALDSVASTLSEKCGAQPKMMRWRASDILQSRREMLSCGPLSPCLVFGDLMARASGQVRAALQRKLCRAITANQQAVSRGVAAAIAQRQASRELLQQLAGVMRACVSRWTREHIAMSVPASASSMGPDKLEMGSEGSVLAWQSQAQRAPAGRLWVRSQKFWRLQSCRSWFWVFEMFGVAS